MAEKKRCALCFREDCDRQPYQQYIGFDFIRCKEGYSFGVEDSVEQGSDVEVQKRYNLIAAFLLRSPSKPINGIKSFYRFYFDENEDESTTNDLCLVNLAIAMRNYPKDFLEKMDAALFNMSLKYKEFGQLIDGYGTDIPLLYCENPDTAVDVLNLLFQLGYLGGKYRDQLSISAEGWRHVDHLKQKNQEINQGFIAMAFRAETKEISDAFQQAIRECGYVARRIDEKEHNNQIVPEIFFEIRRSKFVVVDVTCPNYGAYYEAGFAEALGKQVIVCCRADVFGSDKRPHFDIAQKSTVVWSDSNDLIERLKRRIEATIGNNIR